MPPPANAARSRLRNRCLGGLVWGAASLLVAVGLGDLIGKVGGSSRMVQIAEFWLGRERLLTFAAAPGLVLPGDPVFWRQTDGAWIQVGFIEAVRDEGGAPAASREATVHVRWHDRQIAPHDLRLTAHRNRGTLAEMAQILLPPEKRAVIGQLISDAMRQHGDALIEQFMPLVEQSVYQSLPVVEAEFLASLERHRDELDRLGRRWREELVKERLLPLAREHLLPIARRHAEPTIREIGRELWDRASLWSFTWRAAYDRTPLPRRDLMREEWERFIREDATPVIRAHSEELAAALQRTLADLLREPTVRAELAAAASEWAGDPETRALIGAVLRETLVDNVAVRQVWAQVWSSDEAALAYDRASTLLGPLVHQIGVEIMGSPQRGIDPGLARVLRHQILGKDRRWVVAAPAAGPPAARPRIERGSGDPVFPVLYLAAESPPS